MTESSYLCSQFFHSYIFSRNKKETFLSLQIGRRIRSNVTTFFLQSLSLCLALFSSKVKSIVTLTLLSLLSTAFKEASLSLFFPHSREEDPQWIFSRVKRTANGDSRSTYHPLLPSYSKAFVNEDSIFFSFYIANRPNKPIMRTIIRGKETASSFQV